MIRRSVPSHQFPEKSYYGKIDAQRFFQREVEDCIPWLRKANLLIRNGEDGVGPVGNEAWREIQQARVQGVPSQTCRRRTSRELKEIRDRYKDSPAGPDAPDLTSPDSLARLKEDYRQGRERILALAHDPIPPDAIACYYPFHSNPNHWGIYISLRALFEHAVRLVECFSDKLFVLGNLESVLRCVLFEIFHHEFFHHVVESTATTLEILSAAFGPPRPIYREYGERMYTMLLGPHPHEPLEEALANAYAYNAFGFVSRTSLGYLTIEAKCYREVMRKGWGLAPPGYRSAVHYVSGRGDTGSYFNGAAQLTAMLLGTDVLDVPSLLLLSREVMPRGHTALVQKAHLPTILVGPDKIVEKFFEFVPAPTEAYTELFWPRDTRKIDQALQRWRQRRKRVKAPQKTPQD